MAANPMKMTELITTSIHSPPPKSSLLMFHFQRPWHEMAAFLPSPGYRDHVRRLACSDRNPEWIGRSLGYGRLGVVFAHGWNLMRFLLTCIATPE